MRNTDTHSDACLVPTPDTPPVMVGAGRDLTYVSVCPRNQADHSMQGSLTPGREANCKLPQSYRPGETVEPCAAPQAVQDGMCDTHPA